MGWRYFESIVVGGDFQRASAVTHNWEEPVVALLQNVHRVDDCIDGLDFIVDHAMNHTTKHQEIFKECYQISLCYLNDLKASLDDLLKFPIHLLMDVRLSELAYRYSKEDLKSFLYFVEKFPQSNDITHAGIALNWYKNLEGELNKLHRFIYEIKERLKELYFQRTDIHLLTSASVLHKRHTVLNLFSEP